MRGLTLVRDVADPVLVILLGPWIAEEERALVLTAVPGAHLLGASRVGPEIEESDDEFQVSLCGLRDEEIEFLQTIRSIIKPGAIMGRVPVEHVGAVDTEIARILLCSSNPK